jgi:hypothetical protein
MKDFIQKINPKGGIKPISSSGSPEGSIIANVGRFYINTLNEDVYFKFSGDNTNTGWTLINAAGGGGGFGAGDLSMTMTARLSNNVTVSTVAPMQFDSVDSSVDLEGNSAVSLSNGGFFVKAGYVVYLDGFLKSWQNSKYITFRWYRNSVLIQNTFGGDTTASDTDTNTGSGRSAITVYQNATDATFYLYWTGGIGTQIFRGNSNIASSQISIMAYKS